MKLEDAVKLIEVQNFFVCLIRKNYFVLCGKRAFFLLIVLKHCCHQGWTTFLIGQCYLKRTQKAIEGNTQRKGIHFAFYHR